MHWNEHRKRISFLRVITRHQSEMSSMPTDRLEWMWSVFKSVRKIDHGCIALIDLDWRPLILVLLHERLSLSPSIIQNSNRNTSRLYLSYRVLKVLTNEIALQHSFIKSWRQVAQSWKFSFVLYSMTFVGTCIFSKLENFENITNRRHKYCSSFVGQK